MDEELHVSCPLCNGRRGEGGGTVVVLKRSQSDGSFHPTEREGNGAVAGVGRVDVEKEGERT